MEAASPADTETLLARLPLVHAGLAEFEGTGLRPYPGFCRLFEGR
jgi:hypothetical protein